MTDAAPPIGRALRVLLGAALLAVAAPYLLRARPGFLLAVGAAIVGLGALYAAVHGVLARRATRLNRWAGAALALLPAVLVYVGGGAPGQLGVLVFIGGSLVIVGLRGDPTCEVLGIPNAIFGRRTHLPCLVFTPLDRLERRVRGTSAPP